MKILLTAINAKYIHSNLAVYDLRAYAKEYRDSVELAEYTINHRSEYILQEIYKRKPDVLCFSCYIWNYEYVKEVASEFHKLRPEVPIWVGGPEVSYEIERMFVENPSFYGVVIGEGEATFPNCVRITAMRKGDHFRILQGSHTVTGKSTMSDKRDHRRSLVPNQGHRST